MKLPLFLLTLVAIFAVEVSNSAASGQPIQPKIVNGQPADGQRWPALGALIFANLSADRGQFCAATLIAPRWALTAAHCLPPPEVEADIIFKRPDLRFPTGIRRAVVKSFAPQPSARRPVVGDYALLYLNQAVTDIAPLRLAKSQRLGRRQLLIAGWGSTEFGGSAVNILRQGKIRVRSDRRCRQSYSVLFYRPTMFCAGTQSGVDACQGDSGGPATNLSGRVIFGVVSQGRGCGDPQYPGIYTRVANARAWINKVLAQGPGVYRQRQPGIDVPYQPIIADQIYATVQQISEQPNRYRLHFFLSSLEPMAAATVAMPAEVNPCPSGAGHCPAPGERMALTLTEDSRVATLTVDVDPGCYWFDWQAQFADQRITSQAARYQLKTCRT